jgi:predicted secreted protein
MRLAGSVLALLCMALPAWSADTSIGNAIGFSADGRYFAFEQYGTQDGSGFSFADVFVIDLEQDKWMPGTPAQVVIEEEKVAITEARKRALAQADPALKAAGISETAIPLAVNQPTEIVENRQTIVFDLAYMSQQPLPNIIDGRYELSVSQFTAPDMSNCAQYDLGDEFEGFRLDVKELKSGKTVTLHQDTQIPASRGCPSSYDIDSVWSPADGENSPYLVALIGVYGLGFEGQNRRLIAVPVKLP